MPRRTTILNPALGAAALVSLREFIDGVGGADCTLPHALSCHEAAAAVVTFSNLLGRALHPALVRRDDCSEFHVNRQPQGVVQRASSTIRETSGEKVTAARHVVDTPSVQTVL